MSNKETKVGPGPKPLRVKFFREEGGGDSLIHTVGSCTSFPRLWRIWIFPPTISIVISNPTFSSILCLAGKTYKRQLEPYRIYFES